MKSCIATNSTEFATILKCFGLSAADKVGGGAFSAVYRHAEGVAKFTVDSLWVDYIKACGHLPAAPTPIHIARDVLRYRGRPMSFVLMPRYTAVKPNSKEGQYSRALRLIRAQEQERLIGSALTSVGNAGFGAALLNNMSKRAERPGMNYVADTLRGIARFIGRHPAGALIGVDLHNGNFLFDPVAHRLILADPLVMTDHPMFDDDNSGQSVVTGEIA